MNLLGRRAFLPLFVAQTMGALNDNVLRAALVTLITYHAAELTPQGRTLMVTIAMGLFMVPFFLFSAFAGQLADRMNKTTLIRWIKGAEVGIALLSSYGFYHHDYTFLMVVLFFMGIHSAFFGPVKYAILPDLLKKDQLIQGNGLMQAGTFLAILMGTLVGGLMVTTGALSTYGIAGLIVAIALMGLAASFFIPPALPVAGKKRPLSYNFSRLTQGVLLCAREDKRIFLAILGSTWFLVVGATFLGQMPNYAKDILRVDQGAFVFLLMLFSVGVGLGTIACQRLVRGEITTKFVPISALLMTGFILDLAFSTQSLSQIPLSMERNLDVFLGQMDSWRIVIDLGAIAFLGGIYIVPLGALIQHLAPAKVRSQILAASNIVDALSIVISSAIAIGVLMVFGSISHIFWVLAGAQVVVAFYICRLLPEHLVRFVLRRLFRALYGFRVEGLENLKKVKGRAVIVANHTSFLDGLLLMAALPENLTFAVNTHMASRPWIGFFLSLGRIFPIDPTNPMSLKRLTEEVQRGHKVVIFPEGRLTMTGALMKIYHGPGMIADKAKAPVLPIRIEGAQHSIFSRLRGKIHRSFVPKISLHILPPVKFNVPDDLVGRERREIIGDSLYRLMSQMMFDSSPYHQNLIQSLLEARDIHGRDSVIGEDVQRKPMTLGQLVTKSFALGRSLGRHTFLGENVGLMMPNCLPALVSLFAMISQGRVPTLLNPAQGSKIIGDVCHMTGVTQVLTLRSFVYRAGLQDLMITLESLKIKVLYLEDLAPSLRILDKLSGLAFCYLPWWMVQGFLPEISSQDPAVVLFTSGSEGMPKGVVLSHENIQANRYQVAARIDFNASDTVFNALPLFHSFGLTTATLLPVLSGIRVFFYPSPLHYRQIAELIYDTNSTLLFGTDTFLSGYGREAHAYDFYSLRYVFAGAERLKPETRDLWLQKFGIRIFEGYGATETAPALSLNTPMRYRAGSVGQLLPGITYKLEAVEGITEGQRLHVKGPNIFMGYYLAQKPGEIQRPPKGWHDLGDIVFVDPEGFVFIKGRAKRFAKIGGEMVSLTAVESLVQGLSPQAAHAVISVQDAKKGERLVLFTTDGAVTAAALQALARTQDFPELGLPKEIRVLESLPLLGTGKIDYAHLARMASEQ